MGFIYFWILNFSIRQFQHTRQWFLRLTPNSLIVVLLLSPQQGCKILGRVTRYKSIGWWVNIYICRENSKICRLMLGLFSFWILIWSLFVLECISRVLSSFAPVAFIAFPSFISYSIFVLSVFSVWRFFVLFGKRHSTFRFDWKKCPSDTVIHSVRAKHFYQGLRLRQLNAEWTSHWGSDRWMPKRSSIRNNNNTLTMRTLFEESQPCSVFLYWSC